MDAQFRPLQWPGPSTEPGKRRSRYIFKANWSSTLDLLDRELAYLRARDIVIEAGFGAADIRRDGMPRANARPPQHPGVRIAFVSKFGALVYSTDLYEFWQHNVRAIALGLEALRAVDRYGVTKRGEQYTGWAAIEAPKPTNPDAAAIELGSLAGWPVAPPPEDRDAVQQAYRSAARRCHPDTGGSTELFQHLQAVMAVLGEEGTR